MAIPADPIRPRPVRVGVSGIGSDLEGKIKKIGIGLEAVLHTPDPFPDPIFITHLTCYSHLDPINYC